MSLTIRPATAADASQILAFITELAIYERAGHEVKASEEDIQRSLFADNVPAKALMCLYDDKPIGYAVYFYSYSPGSVATACIWKTCTSHRNNAVSVLDANCCDTLPAKR